MNMNILKTPRQILLEQSGTFPRYEEGGEVEAMNPADMRAEMMVRGNPKDSTEIEQPNFADKFDKEPPLKIKNEDIFEEVKQVINNPGKLSPSDFSPEVVKELVKLFGHEIFAQPHY